MRFSAPTQFIFYLNRIPMKKIYTLVVALLCLVITVNAQAPEQFSFQTVIRDAEGKVLKDQYVTIRINIIGESERNVPKYSEIHRIATNQFGLVNLVIGNGSSATNSFSSIDWSKENYYVETEIDPTGGNNMVKMGSSKLLSVPYALYARTSGNANGSNRINEWSRTGNNLYPTDLNDSVGVGTSSPNFIFHVAKTKTEPHITIENTGSNGGATFRMIDQLSNADFKFKSTAQGDFKIRDQTNRLDVMRIKGDSTGNIGIGTGAPSEKLDINGRLRVRDIPVDNSLNDVLVEDINGVVHSRSIETINNWTKVDSLLFADSACMVGIGTAVPAKPLHVIGDLRVQNNNSLFDVVPVPGGLGGGIDLIFNKDNICVGLFKWIELAPVPPAILPNPVFKLFPRTDADSIPAPPGLEISTIGNTGANGVRMKFCPPTAGLPVPAPWHPRIDLLTTGELEINPGGDAGGLVVSNIGSSGQDGVRIELAEGIMRFDTKDTATAKDASMKLDPDFWVESFFDVSFDLGKHRLGVGGIDDGSVLGTRLTLNSAQTIEGHRGDSGELGCIYVRPDTSSSGILRVSNIGSSGDDGVRLSLLNDPISTEIISMDLISSAPIPVHGVGSNELISTYSYDPLGRRIIRSYADTAAGSSAIADVYEYDANSNVVRKSGPPERQTQHDSLRTSYQYDGLNRLVSKTDADLTSPTAIPHTYEYDALNNQVRRTGPGHVQYELPGELRTTTVYDALNRTIIETKSDVSGIGGPPQTIEYDFLANEMRLIANNRVQVVTNLDVQGLLSKLAGTFKIDHPQDPYNKYLIHSFVESPDMMNVYNGNATTDKKGYATVELPEYFESLNMDFRYQLTVVGEFAQAIVKKKVKNNKFTIMTDKPNVEVSWQVTGIRKDTYANENRIKAEVEKEEAMKGKLLYEPKSSTSSIH